MSLTGNKLAGDNVKGNYYQGTFREASVGKTVFITREEAEKALKKVGNLEK